MVSARRQQQEQYEKPNVNPQVKNMVDLVNCVMIPFEENTNPGYPQGLNIYLQEPRGTEKEYDKLDI